MQRHDLLRGALASVVLPALPFQVEKSKLKITGVRLVHPRARRPAPAYTPAPGCWSTGGTCDCVHFVMATPNSPWAELFIPPPGGPPEVCSRFEKTTR